MTAAAMKKTSGRLASKKKRERAANILSMVVLILLGLIVMFPIYWIFRSSLMSNGELYAYPPAFTPPAWRFSNYAETLKVFDYWKFLGNTMTILAHMRRAYIERSAGTMKAEKPELPDRIMDYIERNYARHITIDDLARRFYVSNSTISHLFKQKMGVSIYRYITQRRLIAAKTLIEKGTHLDAVAAQTGFADYSGFYRAFKQEYGISPRQYRNLQE